MGIIGQNAVKVITLPLKATHMPFHLKIQAWNVLLLLKNYCYCPFLALLLLLLTIAKGLPELLLLLLISDLPELLLLLLIEKFSIDQLCISVYVHQLTLVLIKKRGKPIRKMFRRGQKPNRCHFLAILNKKLSKWYLFLWKPLSIDKWPPWTIAIAIDWEILYWSALVLPLLP